MKKKLLVTFIRSGYYFRILAQQRTQAEQNASKNHKHTINYICYTKQLIKKQQRLDSIQVVAAFLFDLSFGYSIRE